MIIDRPTGFFKPVLPSEPSDGGNVVFTISLNDPPRSRLEFRIIPDSIAATLRPPKVFTELERIAKLGDHIKTIKEGFDVAAMNNTSLFYTGQVLDFASDAEQRSVKKNTRFIDLGSVHVADLEGIDLSDTDIELLTDSANNVRNELLADLEELYNDQSSVEASLNNARRTLNETIRAIGSTEAIISASPDPKLSDILDTLNDKKESLLSDIENLETQLSDIEVDIRSKGDELRSVFELIN